MKTLVRIQERKENAYGFMDFQNKYDNPKFIELLEKTIEPSSFICTYVASAIKMLEGDNVKIYGFSTTENPEAKYFVEENGEDSDEGHHFAVMNNRYIIDPWVYDNFSPNGGTFNTRAGRQIKENYMIEKQRIFWDNVDEVLLEEFRRQKGIAKFKKQVLRNKIMYN